MTQLKQENNVNIDQLKNNNLNKKLTDDSFLKTYFNFLKDSLVFILFSLFNGLLPIITCLFLSMIKPFGTQYAMAIGYITAIQLGFLQLSWTIILTLVYSFKKYKNAFISYESNQNEFITFSLIMTLIYSLVVSPIYFGSSYVYNMYASNHLNTIIGQQQAFYFIYISWIFTFISSFVSTIIINFQLYKNWKYAVIFQLMYMILTIAFAYIFTILIPISNTNSSTRYEKVYSGFFIALGMIIGSLLSLIILYISLVKIIKFKFKKIENLKYKIKFHLKNSWRTLLVILSIQVMKAFCLIGIGIGLQDSVDGLVPIKYQMTRVVWYNVLYILPFMGYGLSDAIYYYGFTHHVNYNRLTKIIVVSVIGLLIIYIPYATGIYYVVEPLTTFYLTNLNTNLMVQYNLIDLKSIDIEYLINSMLKKPDLFNTLKSLTDPNYLRSILIKIFPQNNPINKIIVNRLCKLIPPYIQQIVDPSTRQQAIKQLAALINKNPTFSIIVKNMFFNLLQSLGLNKGNNGSMLLLPDSYAYLFLVSWCIWYPMGLCFFKGTIALKQHDLDNKEMIMNLLAQAAVISSIVAIGVTQQYSPSLYMYNAWSLPLFITSFLAIIYYLTLYVITYNSLIHKKDTPKKIKEKNHINVANA